MLSTKAQMVPSVIILPVGSFILSPLAFFLYVRRQGLHVWIHDGVQSHESCPGPQKVEEGECVLNLLETPCEVVGK